MFTDSCGEPKFLDDIFNHEKEVVAYVQEALGHSLSGDTSLKLFFVLHGGGDNGKTTLLKTFNRHVMGDYGGLIDVTALMVGASDNKRDTSIADLVGKRFVMSIEVNEGSILNAALIKKLTGDDDQIARRLFHEHFQFSPQYKLCIDTNELPVASVSDQALWNWMRPIPFNVRYYDPDSPEAAEGMPV